MSCKHLRMEANRQGYVYTCSRPMKETEQQKLSEFLLEAFQEEWLPGRCSLKLLDLWHRCPLHETMTSGEAAQ